jgi:DNA-directed RNA polymerase subunit alpha
MNLSIQTPSITSVDDQQSNIATFTVEPLHTGYGMTIANSFRRTLLSSISGAGVIAFRIEGVSHEYSTIDGVLEDVVAISQNIKGLRFRVYKDGQVTIRLSKKGKGIVTGADISTDSDIEVVNKEHVIATIDDSSVEINIDLIVEKGRGYRALDESDRDAKIADYISIDTIFSPVLRVRYKVENVRVGQMTNLDKVVLTVETDGTITPRDAFEEAAAILASQYTALAGQSTVVTVAAPIAGAAGSSDVLDMPSQSKEAGALDTSVEELNFTARTSNALVNNDIHTLRDLFALSDSEMRELKGFGSKAMEEVKEKLADLEI